MINDNTIDNNKEQLTCLRCNYLWKPRKEEEIPKRCPNCKSQYWNIPKTRIDKEYIEVLKEAIILIQDGIILAGGEIRGVRDDGGIYYSLYHIESKMNEYRKDPIKVGAVIYKEFAGKHHFNDGNKRFSHVFAKSIMIALRCHLKLPYIEAVEFIRKIADDYHNVVTIEEIEAWLRSNCEMINENDVKTYLKTSLFDVIQEQDKWKFLIK